MEEANSGDGIVMNRIAASDEPAIIEIGSPEKLLDKSHDSNTVVRIFYICSISKFKIGFK